MASYLIEKDKLEGEYNKVFDRVEGYTIIRPIDEDTKEEMLMNLVDILYSAQLDGKPAEKIVGKDIDRFCKEYFSDYHSWQKAIKEFPNWLYRLMWIIVVFSVLELVFPEEERGSVWNATTEASPYIFGTMAGVVSSLLFLVIGNIIWAKYKRIRSNLLYAGVIIVFILTLIISMNLTGDIQWEMPLIPLLLVAGCYVFVYKCWQLSDRHKKYGNFKKPPKDGSFKEIIKEGIKETSHKELPLELKKVYEKKNRKLAKRGKPEMTAKDFMEYLYKQERQTKIGNWIILVLYIGIDLVTVVSTALDSGSTWYDTVSVGAGMGIMLGVVYFIYKKLINISVNAKGELLRECEEKGITVLDLAQQIEERKIKEQSNMD